MLLGKKEAYGLVMDDIELLVLILDFHRLVVSFEELVLFDRGGTIINDHPSSIYDGLFEICEMCPGLFKLVLEGEKVIYIRGE